MKLSEKELQILKELQTKGNQLIFTLGQIEAQKASVFNQIQEVQKEQDKLGKELQEKYPDVTYLFISMDKNYEAWTKGIEKYDVQGEHYLTSDGMKGVFGKSIKLDWIPRYMVVDKTGKIALFKVIEADDDRLIETLEKLK